MILLYCAVTFTGSPRPDLGFALPKAINLAEIGRSMSDKRVGRCYITQIVSRVGSRLIGYLFCVELMPPDHPANLLLVNTLRKVRFPFALQNALHNYVLPRTWKALRLQRSAWPWIQSSSIPWKTLYLPSRLAFTIPFLIIRQYTSLATIKYISFTRGTI